jgi:hypothetical protein
MRIVLGVVSLACSLCAVELALRPWPPVLASGWLVAHPEKRVLDDDLIVTAPSFRDPATYRVDPKRPTLIALGDSFTESYPVAHEQTYPATLGRLLEDAGFPMNVINLGLGDTGPDQQLRLLETVALAHVHPDVVVWQFCDNDVPDNARKAVYTIDAGRLRPISGRDNWLYRRQQLLERTPLPDVIKRNSRIYQYVMKLEERGLYAHVPKSSTAEEWPLDKIRLEVAYMNRLAEEHGFLVYVAIVTPQVAYLDDAQQKFHEAGDIGFSRAHYTAIRDLLAGERRFIDLHMESPTDEPAWKTLFCDEKADANPLGQRHYNAVGYSLMAEMIAKRILSDRGRISGAGMHDEGRNRDVVSGGRQDHERVEDLMVAEHRRRRIGALQ